ncbi:thiolase family protein [Candidatus Woesearchaeota archaeon]|nr:thiolase family protein [Candidatus Woesearchaeota archaeon]
MTKFGIEDISAPDLAREAIVQALKGSSMSPNDIDAIVLSNADTKLSPERQRDLTPMLASILKRKLPIVRIPAVCGGGGAAMWSALKLKYNNILVIAVEKIASTSTQMITKEIMHASDNFHEQDEGLIFPAVNAMVAQAHMLKFGTTHDDLALISYKNHHHGSLNPKARFYRKNISLDTIKNAPIICSPFTLYDCSISVNGAAAAIISNDRSDIKVKGSSLAADYLAPFERDELTTWTGTVKSGKEAFQQADLNPSDINVAELHDAFSIVELLAYEDLGFCKKGEGKNFIRDGHPNLDGKVPINTSGGLKARGHPISPTGMAQIVEIADQLRGRCGDRQVTNPKYGLAHNIGGAGGTTTCHILQKW